MPISSIIRIRERVVWRASEGRESSSERVIKCRGQIWQERIKDGRWRKGEVCEAWNRVWCSFHSHESVPSEKSSSMYQRIELRVIWVAILCTVCVDLKGLTQQGRRESVNGKLQSDLSVSRQSELQPALAWCHFRVKMLIWKGWVKVWGHLQIEEPTVNLDSVLWS